MTENNQKKKLFLDTLTSAYNHKEYVHFLQELLNDVQLVAPGTFNKEYSSLSAVIEGHYHIGNYKGSDGKKMALFAVQLQNKGNVENARSTQRAFIKALLDNSGCDSALAAFYTMEKDSNGQERPSDKWRLSLVRMEYGFAEGKLSTKLTPAKRYSYLVGKDEPCHTAQERLYDMFVQDEVNPGLNDLEEAFSVETVTKQFFNDYKEKYLAVKEYLEATPDFMAEAERCGFTSEQFTKKLMGQIVFLYFIQKKGWLGVQAFPVRLTEKEYKSALFRNAKAHSLIERVYSQPDGDGISRIDQGALFALSDEDAKFVSTLVKGKAWGEGPKNFMRSLYESCVKRGKNYFDDYLEPLFYEALNVNRGENGFYARFHCRIPFLNGGLFEQLDNYDWENSDFHIPNEMFSNADKKGKDDADGILDIFDRYNFTMAEDEPMEREVAIDPEMLGKVFENLLDVKDRKSKGAFYTPREIVHYMCQESLINYLATSTGIEEEDIRKFILYGEYFRDNDCLKIKEVYKDGKRSYTIDKERDMEMPESIFSFKANVNRLKEIDDLLDNVKIADPAVGSGAFLLGLLNEIVRARQTLSAYMAIEMNGFQRLNFYSYGRKTYDLKVNTIKNCLFACDLEPSATDITKLRLWLSIVIDDETVKQDSSDGMFDVHTDPRQLPNLDCNVICGNSLMDEFESISLITESSLLNNQSKVGMDSFYQADFDNMLSKLIKLQDELYFTKDHESKQQIKAEIQNIYDRIILHQLEGSQEAVRKYKQVKSNSSQPFILWQLYFPKVFKEKTGFDIVIGNPPYVDSEEMTKSMPHEREVYSKKFSCAKGNWDLFVLFIEKGINLVRKDGVQTYIVPNKLVSAPYTTTLRKFMSKNQILEIKDYSNVNVFKSAAVYPVVYRLKKSEKQIDVIMDVMDDMTSITNHNVISSEKFYNDIDWDRYFNANVDDLALIDKISEFPTLESLADVNGAATVNEAYLVKEFLYDEKEDNDQNIKFINTGGIDKYKSFHGIDAIRYIKGKYFNPVVNIDDLKNMSEKRYKESISPKIIIGGMNKTLECLFDNGEYLAGKSTTIVYNNEHLKYITAILNSSLMSYYYSKQYNSMSLSGGFFRIGAPQIKKLPIAVTKDKNILSKVEELVDKIQSEIKTHDADSEIVHDIYFELDCLVNKIYGLTEKECAIVTNKEK